MKKEKVNKYLDKIADTAYADALEEYLNNEIEHLKTEAIKEEDDISKVIAHKKAIRAMKGLVNRLTASEDDSYGDHIDEFIS